MSRSFPAEADMLAPIAAGSRVLAGPRAYAFFEVSSMAGVPDVVFARFNGEQLRDRSERGCFLVDAAPLAVVLTLAALGPNPGVADNEIASLAALSVRYTSGTVLPALREGGWVEMTQQRHWVLTRPFRSVVEHLVAVEAKLTDWRRGLAQATRLAAGADAVWLALDCERTSRPVAAPERFRHTGVGLAAVHPTGRVDALIAPQGVGVLDLRREMLAERVAAMHVGGLRSGPISPVFGRRLVATTGLDPRLAGAAAR